MKKTQDTLQRSADTEFGWNINKDNSGFFDLPIKETCIHPEHDFPKNLHIPTGKGYKHICPSCGNVIVVIPRQITL